MMNRICVVMSTYNGEKYLREQLDSIFCQRNVEVILFVRDDGSTDQTIEILEEYKHNNIILEKGENCGAKISFLKALTNAPAADYYAFADQDDVWDEDKLAVAVEMIKEAEKNEPEKCVLYCGRTRLVDDKLNEICTASNAKINTNVNKFLRGQLRNSAGCTMAFNRRLKEVSSIYMPSTFPMHDAWLSILCLAVGGKVVYDPVPHMKYRQHGNNTVGGKRGTFASIKRRLAFHKKMGKCYHTRMLKEIYERFNQIMPEENVERYIFVSSYKNNIKNKVKVLRDKEFLKGTKKYKIETFLLVLFNCY